jgi:hypothetical protein
MAMLAVQQLQLLQQSQEPSQQRQHPPQQQLLLLAREATGLAWGVGRKGFVCCLWTRASAVVLTLLSRP